MNKVARLSDVLTGLRLSSKNRSRLWHTCAAQVELSGPKWKRSKDESRKAGSVRITEYVRCSHLISSCDMLDKAKFF